ncbi:YvcK family protein [Patescibacteria group bacterium]|nr:YvcK family protein [Patescibacteria group bacterium]
MKKDKQPLIVVIGGGTGTFTALSGLKDLNCRLAAVVTMADSGGSNRVLRDDFGILPTSDIRQCMVALASLHGNREVLRQLFTYRFHQGNGISGMTFGNLFMAALTDIYQDQQKAIKITCDVLGIKDKILPVTLNDVQLVARYEDGTKVVGEHLIDEPKHDGSLRLTSLSTKPVAAISPQVRVVLEKADLILIGPGDLYTSLICNLVVGGMVPALKASRAKKIFTLNLMTKWGQTHKFTARDHVNELKAYLGEGVLDGVIVNSNWSLSKKVLSLYNKENSEPVKDDLSEKDQVRIVKADVVAPVVVGRKKGDKLWRSIIRHDSKKLARAVLKFLN